MAIDEIELAKSGRAKCNYCGRLIGKGTPRGLKTIHEGTYTSEKYFCYKCTLIVIDQEIKTQKQLKKELNQMIKKNQKALILMEL